MSRLTVHSWTAEVQCGTNHTVSDCSVPELSPAILSVWPGAIIGARVAHSWHVDIARSPEFKLQKRRRQIAFLAAAVVVVVAVTIGVSRLKPAAPLVERGTVWTDTVKRGPMLRQVRGLGSLVPTQEAVRQIPG